MITFFAAQAELRFGMNYREAERFLKFAVVGTIGFIVDFGLLYVLKEFVGLPTIIANTLSFCARQNERLRRARLPSLQGWCSTNDG